MLVYTTSAFDHDTNVTGPVGLDVYASSDAVDTDFTGKLVDVGPDGFARNLTEGIIRARYRDAQGQSSLMQPGNVYRFHIDLWSTSNMFLAGHKLRHYRLAHVLQRQPVGVSERQQERDRHPNQRRLHRRGKPLAQQHQRERSGDRDEREVDGERGGIEPRLAALVLLHGEDQQSGGERRKQAPEQSPHG